jgi:hypothetical protein
MPTVNISVPHNLGKDEAKRRLQGFISDAKIKFKDKTSDVRENWTEDRNDFGFHAMGMTVAGSMQVHPSTVNIRLDLPFIASPFKGAIEREITDKAQQILA